ncbi:MAG: exodeoxyribonuclease V subunit gamma [Aeromicrobium sp.]
MPLILHRAPRADLLAESLAALLQNPLPDPFASELVLVPARGVERWLSQRLSHRLGSGGHDDGVCAGVEFRTPHSLVSEVLGTGPDDTWAPDNVVWPLLRVIDENAGEAWCATLDRHLGRNHTGDYAEVRRGRRFALARRLAGLFASYATQRPRLLTAWEQGDDTDGAGGTIATDLAWQPELWRQLVASMNDPTPSQRHAQVLADLRAAETSVALPPRLSLFGHTRIAATEIELLGALGTHREVHLWLPHPSVALWDSLADVAGTVPRAADTSHELVDHPLLASLGRDLRELQRSLGPVVDESSVVEAQVEPPSTLLGLLQHDLAVDVRPDVSTRSIAPDDRSVQVHACHGPARQVEVLREVLLGLLADDPTLEPRDILVMCPDIEAYAPLVEAAFGLGGVDDVASHASARWHPGHRLQVRLADRSLTQTNPLLSVVSALLDLAGGRVEASRVLDLMATAPVRRRFGLSEDDMETVTRWVEVAGVRWAFDADHRSPFGLQHYLQNTWRFGLDRVLAGVVVSDDAERWIDTVLPLDDVGSNSIDLAGRVAELVDRLRHVADRLSGSHPVGHWLDALRQGVDTLTAVGWGDEWQLGQVHRELTAIGAEHGDTTDLRLPDVKSLMAERLAGRPTRANFRSGSLTVCTMVPMRSVPHRVVCLLGLDDGVFPRSTIVDGDDALARMPMTGERDPRSEDRQLLLDAVLAAGEHLVVTYSGADEVSGQPRPPAVPLGELLDALDVTVDGARDQVLTHHPLQPFDPLNLTPGRLDARPFSFDAASLAGARAAVRERREPDGFDAQALPALPADDVDLASLVAFAKHPVKEFLRRRAQIVLPDEGKEVLDGLPIAIDGLVEWGIGERLLRDLLRGRDEAAALGMEWRRGELPPGRLGWREAQRIRDEAVLVADLAVPVIGTTAVTSLDVDVDLGRGRRLRGTVTGVHGDQVVKATYSRLGEKHELDAWISLLALGGTWSGRAWTACAIGRGRKGKPPVTTAFDRADDAVERLGDLVRLYDAGMREPLPLPLKAGHAWAEQRSRGANDRACTDEAAKQWSGWLHEDQDPHHVRVWGHGAPFDVLLAAAPAPGEEVDGEISRLGALAHTLWGPVLERGQRS